MADEFKASYADHVIEAMSRGLTVQASAAEIGYCRDTIYEWARTHPEMERALKIGKAKRVLKLEGLLLSISESGIGNIAGVIFALKNADPDEWRDSMPPLPPVQNSTEQSDLVLAQRLAFILTNAGSKLAGKTAGKLIEGKARPNGANGHATKNGHG